MIDLIIDKAVNLALLRQQLDKAGVIYSVLFSGDVMTLQFADFDSAELGQVILDTHDAKQLTTEQAAAQAEDEARAAFLAQIDSAVGAIGQMAADTVATIGRIQATVMDEAVKAELVAMNLRTVELLRQLEPFITQVVALVQKHTVISDL